MTDVDNDLSELSILNGPSSGNGTCVLADDQSSLSSPLIRTLQVRNHVLLVQDGQDLSIVKAVTFNTPLPDAPTANFDETFRVSDTLGYTFELNVKIGTADEDPLTVVISDVSERYPFHRWARGDLHTS